MGVARLVRALHGASRTLTMPSGAIRLQCETATAKLVTAWFQP